jgi:hypothetical protein
MKKNKDNNENSIDWERLEEQIHTTLVPHIACSCGTKDLSEEIIQKIKQELTKK